jgi:hypothetical protein
MREIKRSIGAEGPDLWDMLFKLGFFLLRLEGGGTDGDLCLGG